MCVKHRDQCQNLLIAQKMLVINRRTNTDDGDDSSIYLGQALPYLAELSEVDRRAFGFLFFCIFRLIVSNKKRSKIWLLKYF